MCNELFVALLRSSCTYACIKRIYKSLSALKRVAQAILRQPIDRAENAVQSVACRSKMFTVHQQPRRQVEILWCEAGRFHPRARRRPAGARADGVHCSRVVTKRESVL